MPASTRTASAADLSLLDWAADPYAEEPPMPSPLPPQFERYVERGPAYIDGKLLHWPVGYLDAKLLATDLARQGFTATLNGPLLENGVPVAAPTFASAVVDLLAHAADRLNDWAAISPAIQADVDGLRQTVRHARRRESARMELARMVKAYLPAPTASTDPELAERWLSSYDTERLVPRADLWRSYDAAGRPGGMSKAELFELCAQRWGRVKHLAAGYFFKPQQAVAQ